MSVGGLFCFALVMFLIPRINDITTDPKRPPKIVALTPEMRSMDLVYPEEFWEKQAKRYHHIGPLELREGVDLEVFWAELVNVIESRDEWKILSIDNETKRIQLVATTPLLRFKDDLVIELRQEAQSQLLHLRSRSRLGQADFGANASRIDEILKELELKDLGRRRLYEDSSH